MDLEVDCTNTDEGDWFEVKGWLEFAGGYTGWELDVNQGTCSGEVGGLAPSASTNHKARCVGSCDGKPQSVSKMYISFTGVKIGVRIRQWQIKTQKSVFLNELPPSVLSLHISFTGVRLELL